MNNFNEIVRRIDHIVKTLGSKWLKGAWEHEAEINRVMEILADDESRDNYGREIMWCFLNTFLKGQLAAQMAGMMSAEKWKKNVLKMMERNIHPEIEAPSSARGTLDYSKTATFILEQYRYKEEVSIDPGDVCLDLGACLGDTAIWMAEQGAGEVHAFEIDPVNREYMLKTFARSPDYAKIRVVPKAISSSNAMYYMIPNEYNAGAGQIQREKPDSGLYSRIECTTLDSYCEQAQIRPDFIKMDIEGSELDAINGATSIFTGCRPKFAICIYHKREHRWEIPLRLAELCPDYRFFVKKSHPVFETVVYGCPVERNKNRT